MQLENTVFENTGLDPIEEKESNMDSITFEQVWIYACLYVYGKQFYIKRLFIIIIPVIFGPWSLLKGSIRRYICIFIDAYLAYLL
jgi:hypothetical protein